MIKKLRFKLILITILSVLGVLTLIMVSLNLTNYITTTNDIDMVIDKLIENGGSFDDLKPEKEEGFPTPPSGENPPAKPEEGDTTNSNSNFVNFAEGDGGPGAMGRETIFETRYFTVKFTFTNDATTTVDVKNVSIEESEALALAQSVLNKERGYTDDYRYRVVTDESSKTVYFVDAETRLGQVRNYILISSLTALASLVLVFVIIFFLSKRIIKPISDAYDRQKRFITNAAHELKTPLTIISANNEMMEITAGENELTAGINKQVVRMNNMVKNLSALSKIDDTSNVNKKSFNIVETVDDMLETFSEAFAERNIEITKNYDKDLPYKGDEGLIRQLFSIILDNAIKYAKSNLTVKADVIGNKINISFINDAAKINVGNLDKCFERFYRFDETRASGIDGSGIGLSIAKEIVVLHNGDIHAIGHENNLFEIKITL